MRNDEIIILHISDIHRSKQQSVSTDTDLLRHLLEDIKNGYRNDNREFLPNTPRLPSPNEIDLVFLSGDISQHADKDEFSRAEKFLVDLISELPEINRDREKVVIVPGNHDVCWVHSNSAYVKEFSPSKHLAETYIQESIYRLSLASWPPKIFRRIIEGAEKDLYNNRLKQFALFYERFYGYKQRFPLDDPEGQYSIFDSFTQQLGIVVVGFSSCAMNDHLWRRGWIHPNSISAAAEELDRRGWSREKYFRVAVWHHNIYGNPDKMDFMDSKLTRLMADLGFTIGFHGHIHEMSKQKPAIVRRELLVIGAGSMFAAPNERPEGVPLQYNVVGVSLKQRKGWVHIRGRSNMYESWHAHYQYGPNRNVCWIPIEIQDQCESKGLIFSKNDSPEFRSHVKTLMEHANNFTMIGTGLAILFEDPFRMAIMDRAAKGSCKLEIYLADPASPAVEMRLIEEELGIIKPPVGKSGLLKHLNTLLTIWQDKGYPNTIKIGLFTHYPTFALIIIDTEYFIYPYGYATLGNFSPVLSFSKEVLAHRDVIDFLDNHYELVKAHAIDAKKAFDFGRKDIIRRRNFDIKDLQPFALYFIPPVTSDLYQFGTNVLGYDIRSGNLQESVWSKQLGTAQEFGFHLTLCDALYLLNEAEVKSIEAEITFLLKNFRPFDLQDLHLESGFPDANSISIRVEDQSGSLEALHHEIVHRVYRRAAASNYELGLAGLKRDKDFDRARLMIERYHAPYILQCFTPHFTLLTNVLPEEQPQALEKLEKNFSQKVQERTIRLERLALMTRSVENNMWVIKEEIQLYR